MDENEGKVPVALALTEEEGRGRLGKAAEQDDEKRQHNDEHMHLGIVT